MIIVTGAAGFIGSNLVSKLNQEGFKDIVVVDDFSIPEKNRPEDRWALRSSVKQTDSFYFGHISTSERIKFIFGPE